VIYYESNGAYSYESQNSRYQSNLRENPQKHRQLKRKK
jgi:hypothetical protein